MLSDEHKLNLHLSSQHIQDLGLRSRLLSSGKDVNFLALGYFKVLKIVKSKCNGVFRFNKQSVKR